MTYLLDTNVLSETSKDAPNPRVIAWLGTCEVLCWSAVTTYELARGIGRVAGRKRRFLDAWFARLVASGGNVLPFDDEVALAAAALEQDARRSGKPIDERDLFILATAKAKGLHLATQNVVHFRGRGVRVYNPFDDSYA